MGFDRHQGSAASQGAQPVASAQGPGKQTLVATALAGTGAEAEHGPGKHSLVSTELESTGAPMQRKAHSAGEGAGPPPSGGGGTPLPPEVRSRMEAAIGGNFAGVRVHQHAYAQAIGALAFTRGVDIYFAPGRFDPVSPQGLELIGHELTHVKQQAEGRVLHIRPIPRSNDSSTASGSKMGRAT